MYDYNKSMWINPDIEYLFNEEIHEYDIVDAGLSIIKQYKLLPHDKILYLSGLNKYERHVSIGIEQKNNRNLSITLNEKFALIRNKFITANNINPNMIISVKKDAMFISGECNNLTFGDIKFVKKQSYSSYVRLVDNSNIELYYNGDIDIKGIGDSALNKHRLYMIGFIMDIIQYIESNNKYAKRYLRKFINDYKTGELSDEYYVEFNNKSISFNPIFNYSNVIIPFVKIIMKEMV